MASQTPRVATFDPRLANIDARTLAMVHAGIRDRIYQRSINLRRTYRLLDPEGRGKVTYSSLVEEMTKTYQLSPLEQHCLRILIDRADYNKDGFIDFVEFNSLLKMVQVSENGDSVQMSDDEKRRFRGQGFIDQRMSKMVLHKDRRVPMVAPHPTNELGRMMIDAPYGVLGDSERMDSMIHAFLTTKYENLRHTLSEMDANKHGRLTWAQFREAIKHVDKYVFDSEIEALILVLDPRKRGTIVIDEFMNLLGQEFLKKKAHRGAPLNPLVWDVTETPRAPAAPKKPSTARKPNTTTRTQVLRTQENRLRLKELITQIDEHEQKIPTSRREQPFAGPHTARLPSLKNRNPL